MRYDDDYAEEILLRDGRTVTLRAFVRPQAETEALLRGGFERLGSESRRLRFFSGKPRLTDAEVDYLTDVDGDRHLALGALVDGPDGIRGLGVARYVRLPEHPHLAEPAVTIVDEAQGLGLGTLLLDRLVQAARERGVTAFRAEFLAENVAVQNLLRAVIPGVVFHADDDGVFIAEMPLDVAEPQPDEPTLIERIRSVLKEQFGGSAPSTAGDGE